MVQLPTACALQTLSLFVGETTQTASIFLHFKKGQTFIKCYPVHPTINIMPHSLVYLCPLQRTELRHRMDPVFHNRYDLEYVLDHNTKSRFDKFPEQCIYKLITSRDGYRI